MTQLSALGQIALHVGNVDTSETFYREVLGLKPLYRFGELSFFDCAGVNLMLQGGARPRHPGNTLCLYFRVEAIGPAQLDLAARGLEFEGEPKCVARTPEHEVWMLFFRDPDGYLLALMEERH